MTSNYPQVQLRINDKVLVDIPPQYLAEFTYTSRAAGTFSFSVLLHDPKFGELERLLIDSSKINRQRSKNDRGSIFLDARFGFLQAPNASDNLNSSVSFWQNAVLTNITPEFNAIPSLTLNAVARSGFDKDQGPIVFRGKVSDVVRDIAARLNLEPDIEETREEVASTSNLSNLRSFVKDDPKKGLVWRTNGLPWLQFVKDVLAPLALSKESNLNGKGTPNNKRTRNEVDPYSAGYYMHVGSHPTKPVPSGKDGWLIFRREIIAKDTFNIPTFYCLLGYQSGNSGTLIEFKPTIRAASYAAALSSQMVFYNTDATKRNLEPLSLGSSLPDKAKNILTGDGSSFQPPLPHPIEGSGKLKGAKGVYTTPYAKNDQAAIAAASLWRRLHNTMHTATATWLGTPDTVQQIMPQRRARVIAITPEGNIHYSSGIWYIKEAVHSITGGEYKIQTQLIKDSSSGGSYKTTSSKDMLRGPRGERR